MAPGHSQLAAEVALRAKRMNTFQIIILALSGCALFYASSMRLIKPDMANFIQTYSENPTNNLEKDTDLLNEIRGVGAVMLLGGIMVLLGISIPGFRQTSFAIAAVIFVGVVVGRLISNGLDGMPNPQIMRATIIEAVLGALNTFCLISALRADT